MSLQLRRDTAANWVALNSVLDVGEPGFETDTGILRIGDGVTAFPSLPAIGAGGGGGMELLLDLTGADLKTGTGPLWLAESVPTHDVGNGYKIFLMLAFAAPPNALNANADLVFDFNGNMSTLTDPYQAGWAWGTKMLQKAVYLANGASLTTDPASILTAYSTRSGTIRPPHQNYASILLEADLKFIKQNWGGGNTSENFLVGKFYTKYFENSNNGELRMILENEISVIWDQNTNWGFAENYLTQIGCVFDIKDTVVGYPFPMEDAGTDMSFKLYKY